MKKFSILLFTAVCVLSFYTFGQQANIYLHAQLKGFDFIGTSQLKGYEKQVVVYSYSNGITSCATFDQPCKPQLSDFSIYVPLCLAVNDFKAVELTGKTIDNVDLVWLVAGGDGSSPVYKVHMEMVKVTAVQEGSGGELPGFSISLFPGRIAWQVLTQDNTGKPGPNATYGWDFLRMSEFRYNFR